MGLKVKKTIGEYQIVQLLGEGLTSCVYKAIKKHVEWGIEQVVALKIFKSQQPDSTLKQEIQSLAQLDSIHCVKMLGWIDDSDQMVLVLEYLEGVTLEELANHVSLQTKNIDELIAQTQDGLRDLQSLQLRHGDLSPRNIFITKHGVVKLLDFGLSGTSSLKAGTVPYFPPEGWRGEDMTPQSDLFSLGLIRHELLTGKKIRTIEESRRRVSNVQNQNSLLRPDVQSRRFLDLKSKNEERRELAQLVKSVIETKESNSLQKTCILEVAPTKTDIFQKTRHKKKSLLLACLIPFYAQMLHPETNNKIARQEHRSHRLEIRGLKWAEVTLYQKHEKSWRYLHKQYTPFLKESLPSGHYRLDWKSLHQSGRIFVQLKKNQRILLP